MTADDLIDAVRDDQQTALSRLGSSKILYADTRGEMDPDTVRGAAAAREAAARETFDAWADDSEGAVAELFAAAAADAADRLAAADSDPVDREFDMHATLSEFETDAERLGGLLGWTLVDKKVKEQLTGFFTGQADPQTASTFRTAGGDIETLRDETTDLLGDVCTDESDWDSAQAAAVAVVSAAYDDYFETLEELGVNPKPVC